MEWNRQKTLTEEQKRGIVSAPSIFSMQWGGKPQDKDDWRWAAAELAPPADAASRRCRIEGPFWASALHRIQPQAAHRVCSRSPNLLAWSYSQALEAANWQKHRSTYPHAPQSLQLQKNIDAKYIRHIRSNAKRKETGGVSRVSRVDKVDRSFWNVARSNGCSSSSSSLARFSVRRRIGAGFAKRKQQKRQSDRKDKEKTAVGETDVRTIGWSRTINVEKKQTGSESAFEPMTVILLRRKVERDGRVSLDWDFG